MIEYYFKCPLCGEIQPYLMSDTDVEIVTENPNEIVNCVCNACGRTWAKYAYVVFGGDTDSTGPN